MNPHILSGASEGHEKLPFANGIERGGLVVELLDRRHNIDGLRRHTVNNALVVCFCSGLVALRKLGSKCDLFLVFQLCLTVAREELHVDRGIIDPDLAKHPGRRI